jgi:hypothetical protein
MDNGVRPPRKKKKKEFNSNKAPCMSSLTKSFLDPPPFRKLRFFIEIWDNFCTRTLCREHSSVLGDPRPIH